MSAQDFDSRVARIAALAEPVRSTLYRYVAAQPGPVSREQAAAAVGVARHVAKFNLDKLEEEGLLEAEFARPAGRRGPGAGRPAKLYKRGSREVEVSIPQRRYDLAGQVMAQAITSTERDAVPIGEALRSAARQAGQLLGEEARNQAGARPSRAARFRAVQNVLSAKGYEPRAAGKGLSLANCPFHTLAQSYASLICEINVNLIDSMLDTAGLRDVRAELRPAENMCCVRITEPR